MDKKRETNTLPEKPIFRKEFYLDKIATGIAAAGYPDYPISRIEQYLDYIAEHSGAAFEPTEEQLAAMNSGITEAKVTSFEGKQDALNADQLTAVNSGITAAKVTEFEGKQAALNASQLNAVNSGITAALVNRTILAPVSAPSEKVLLGVDTTNSEVQYKLGVGLATDESTSPYTLDVKGVSYLTTAPTSANTAGDLKIVVLSAEPATKYNGYLYLIKEA